MVVAAVAMVAVVAVVVAVAKTADRRERRAEEREDGGSCYVTHRAKTFARWDFPERHHEQVPLKCIRNTNPL